jgi:hypothetical protein
MTTTLRALGLLGLGAALGCGGGSAGAHDAAVRVLCVPGQAIACFGPAACAGGQVCKDDGSGYEPCDCLGPRDAAAPVDDGGGVIPDAADFDAAPACADSDLEPNDTRQTATSLDSALASHPSGVSMFGLEICTPADLDYYAFTLAHAERVSVLVAVTGGALGVAVVDHTGATVATATPSGAGLQVAADVAAGVYYVRVAAGSGGTTGAYDLSLMLSPVGDGGLGGDGGTSCPGVATPIYAVTDDAHLLKLDPRQTPLGLTDIGALGCPITVGQGPYALAVDRDATVFVLATDGHLYAKDLTSASGCHATDFRADQSGLHVFSLAFAAAGAGSATDRLYAAGGAQAGVGDAQLATLDPGTLTMSAITALSGWPVLSGTANATLWAYQPAVSPPQLVVLDTTTGAPQNPVGLASLAGTPVAWGFASWGGDGWVFLKKDAESDSTVYRVDGTSGAVTTALAGTGRTIVAAGVSTCAPLTTP